MFIVKDTFWNPAGGTSSIKHNLKDAEAVLEKVRELLDSERTIEIRIIPTNNPMPT